MPQPHVIRLRGPWLCWPDSSRQATEASAVTIDFRDEDGLSPFHGASSEAQLRLERRFHRPTGLTDTTSVQLVIKSFSGEMTLTLNSEPLGSVDAGRNEFQVADQLQPANRLRIELPAAAIGDHRGLADLFSCQLEIE